MKKNKYITYTLIAYLGLASINVPIQVQAQGIVEATKQEWDRTLDAIEYFKNLKENKDNKEISSEPIKVIKVKQVDEKEDKNIVSQEYYDNEYDELNNKIANNKLISAKQKASSIFCSGVDFIFYDGELKIYGEDKKGIKFKELKDETKETIYNIVDGTREKIEESFPGLLESLDEKYQNAALYMKETKDMTIEKTEEKIGEENTQKINDTKEKTSNYIKEEKQKFNDAVDYFKDLYQKKRKK